MCLTDSESLVKRMELAKWIWLAQGESFNQYVDFRCPFTAEKGKKTQLFISADTGYGVYVNGQLIPAGQYADYPEKKVADVLDITAAVHEGGNLLAVVAYRQGEDGAIHCTGSAGLVFALYQEDALLAVSSKETLCRLSRTYRSGEIERMTPQLSFSFYADLAANDGWMEKNYRCGEDWQHAMETGNRPSLFGRPVAMSVWEPEAPAVLKAQGVFWDTMPQAPMGEQMYRAALSSRHPQDFGLPPAVSAMPHVAGIELSAPEGDGLYLVVDVQRETAGMLSLDLETDAPCEIRIGFGEHLEDLRVRCEVGGRQFAAGLHSRAGRQRFVYPFKRFGCRYLQVLVFAHRVKVHYAGLIPVTYPVKYCPVFHCADALHNQIFQVSRRTLELCMHEHYEDCPWREQALYAMDSRNQMLCGYYVFEGTTFAQASLRLLAMGQREDGLLDLLAPARDSITIPAFSLSFVIAVWENLLYGGQPEFAWDMLPTVQKILAVFDKQQEENGLLSRLTAPRYWNFYEWSAGLDGDYIRREHALTTRYEAPLMAFYALALQAAEKLCCLVGEEAAAQQYHRQQERTCQALQLFWNEQEGAFAAFLQEGEKSHYDELTQSLILTAGACTPEQEEQLLRRLAQPDNGLAAVTLSCRLFLYQAMMRRPEVYGTWVAQDIARVWGKMLFAGATSFWETEKGAEDFGQAGSLCHGWSAVPIWFYYRWVLGIDPESTELCPVFCGLYEPRLER